MSVFTDFRASFWSTTLNSVTMAMEIKLKELHMKYFILDEHKVKQKVALKYVSMIQNLLSTKL